ncbi:MAG: DnaJ domain-containing protein, partial [Sphingomonadales bacterium]|nr:DnaJ domain-containing protein [Sphingomonadales bacterium]
MSTDIDYYDLLEVERTADGSTIKSAYRKLAMKYHPDKNPGCQESEAKFKAIGEAYECLKDPQKRAAYDRFGHAACQQGGMGGGNGFGGGGAGFGDFSDIFDTIVGGGFGGQRQQTRRGADLRYDLEVTLEDAFHGKETTITIDVSTQCESCDGNG